MLASIIQSLLMSLQIFRSLQVITHPSLTMILKSCLSCICLLTLGLTHAAYAQEFAPPGSKWHFNYWMAMVFIGDGYITLEHDGDTLIDGLWSQRLKKTSFVYNGILQQTSEHVDFEHLRSQGDSVFVHRFGQFHLLYDFGAQPGDVWSVAGNSVCEEPGIVVVDSIGTEVLEGVPLRYLHVSSPPTSPNQFTRSRIIERIGCVGYMFPEPMCGITDSDFGGTLRCYADDDVSLLFQAPTACDKLWTDIPSNALSGQSMTVRPTLFQDFLMVEAPALQSDFHFAIHDLSGRVHRSGTVPTDRIIRDLGGLREGMYVLRLVGAAYASEFRVVRL